MAEQRLHPLIRDGLLLVETALSVLKQNVEEVRSKCLHERVAEKEYGDSCPMRICLACGYEEWGSHWSGRHVWSKHNFSEPTVLGNKKGRDILEVKTVEFFRYRIAHTELDVK